MSIHLSIIWHMHQPYYTDPETGIVALPWVRLHTIKSYYPMLSILEEFPEIKVTFNLTPSLIEQINELAEEKTIDNYFELSKKRASELTKKELSFILLNFFAPLDSQHLTGFTANQKNMIVPFSDYYNLLLKRGKVITPERIDKISLEFNHQEITDLQVWFNLIWFNPKLIEDTPELKDLVKKGSKFSESDKTIVLERQQEILKNTLNKYKALKDSGQIEISISPFYHPILPLIYDTNIASVSNPGVNLPSERFNFPEDASWHIREAINFYKNYFGDVPSGMWPSEGSVSEDILPLMKKEGIDWLATDEAVLFNSIKDESFNEQALFYPYYFDTKRGKLNIFFRDKDLSNLISFTYYNMDADKATADFIKRLNYIDGNSDKRMPKLVTVILDGENPWEHYEQSGLKFLRALYAELSKASSINTTTPKKFLDEFGTDRKLDRLYPASWINADFSIWIGEDEKNKSWEYLTKVRSWYEGYKKINPENKNLEKAMRQIYIAEGSDWNWWYGPEHSSIYIQEFDGLYRKHLSYVYKLLGEEVPAFLDKPIILKEIPAEIRPSGFINPTIDGKLTDYFEWLGAGLIDLTKYSGCAIHYQPQVVERVYFGFNLDSLFIRLDFINEQLRIPKKTKLAIKLLGTKRQVIIFIKNFKIEKAGIFEKVDRANKLIKEVNQIKLGKILELGVNFKDLNLSAGDRVGMKILLFQNELILDSIPPEGSIDFVIPAPDFESRHWSA